MHRTNSASSSRFSAFRKPHEILSSTSPTSPFSHSRARNRSSGGSSVGSQKGQPSLLADDSMDDNDRIVSRAASQTASRTSKSRSRSVSPSWGGLSTHSIPLLPMHEGSSGSGAGRSLLSRTPSPYPRKSDDLDQPGTDAGGSNQAGLGSWGRDGKLGWWLRDTQRGWMVYIGLLLVFYSGASFGLSVVNSFTLSSKFSSTWKLVHCFGAKILLLGAVTDHFSWCLQVCIPGNNNSVSTNIHTNIPLLLRFHNPLFFPPSPFTWAGAHGSSRAYAFKGKTKSFRRRTTRFRPTSGLRWNFGR